MRAHLQVGDVCVIEAAGRRVEFDMAYRRYVDGAAPGRLFVD